MAKDIRIAIRIDSGMDCKLKDIAKIRHISVGQLVRDIVRGYIRETSTTNTQQ